MLKKSSTTTGGLIAKSGLFQEKCSFELCLTFHTSITIGGLTTNSDLFQAIYYFLSTTIK